MPPPPPKQRPIPDLTLATSHPISEEEPSPESLRMTDEEFTTIMQRYLRKDHLDSPKVIRFIMSYLECRNQAQAAREAGVPGQGWALRSKPDIHACIEALTAKAVMKYGYDASEIIERVKEISNFDPIEFENADGSYKTHLSMITPQARRAIKKFKVKNLFGEDANGMKIVIGQIIDIEVWDKLKSHELLGREKNIMKETKKIEHDVTKDMKDVLLGGIDRAQARIAAMRDVTMVTGRVDSGEQQVIEIVAGHSDADNGGQRSE